jgi:gliding motility-associated-like protein
MEIKNIKKYCRIVLLMLIASFTMSAAQAAYWVVNDDSDITNSFPGSLMLRDAINSASPGDTIIIEVSGIIQLSSGPITITEPIVIYGPEPIHCTIDANGNQAFIIANGVSGGTVSISGITITNGAVGAAIEIYSSGDLELKNVVLRECSKRALLNGGGTAKIYDCAFYNNHGSVDGAAIRNVSGTTILVNTTLGDNQALATNHGGAIYNLSGVMSLDWCTLVQNSAGGAGGAIQNYDGQVTIRNSIIADNSGGGGNISIGGAGTYSSAGYNLIKDSSPPINTATNDDYNGAVATYVATTPQTNGYGMMYYPITSVNSPAIDAGFMSAGIYEDTRKAPRALDGSGSGVASPDKGAVEYSPFCVTAFSGTGSFDNIYGMINSFAWAAPHYVCFDISGAPPYLVYTGATYSFYERVIIDGYSQQSSKIAGPGAVGSLLTPAYLPIEVDGGVNGIANGIVLEEPNCAYSEIRGVVMLNFGDAAIELNDEECHIYGNHIGFTSNATLAPNQIGIRIGDGTGTFAANNNFIGGWEHLHRNVISGNSAANIVLGTDAGQENMIAGNFIGTSADGLTVADPGMPAIGISVWGGYSTNIGDEYDGGNLISGNAYGIFYHSPSSYSDTIISNYIGVDVTGMIPLTNAISGINFTNGANDIMVGGQHDDFVNVISGNGSYGIDISGCAGIEMYRNIIGLGADVMTPVGNGTNGVYIHNASTDNFVGASDNGNVISSNAGPGIKVTDAGTDSNNIQGNVIGMAGDKTTQRGNGGDAIQILFNAVNTTIGGSSALSEGNLISGNAGFYGIRVGADGTTIQGNTIGLDGSGTVPAPNGAGIYISGATGTIIGGTAAGEGNVISGNSSTGIHMLNSISTVSILGNVIGLDSAGTLDLGNGSSGIYCNDVNDLVIGNESVGSRNVISGNAGSGITCTGAGVTGASIVGNIIGLGSDGNTVIANDAVGIHLDNSSGVVIGSSTGQEATVISGNGTDGIDMSGGCSGIQIVNTIIGENETLTATRPNSQIGIEISGGPISITIGGTNAGEGNRIVGNGQDAIEISGASSSIAILRNVIHSNGGNDASHVEIDLIGSNGVDANDALDGDAGPNELTNYPVLNPVTSNCDNTGGSRITGALDASVNTNYRLEFFSITAGLIDPSGYGGGEVFLGSLNITTDGVGNASFAFNYGTTLTLGDYVTATATQLTAVFVPEHTSEFSAAVIVNDNVSNIAISSLDETCFGANDGTAWIASYLPGGLALSYLWSEGTTTDTLYGMTPGASYTATLNDLNSCGASAGPVIINAAVGMGLIESPTHITCFGANDGEVTLTASGGLAPFTYSNDGGATWQAGNIFSGYAPGGHAGFVVMDANGCTLSTGAVITITEPTQLQLTVTGSAITCFGANDGTAIVSILGGTPTYAVSWSPGGQSIASISGLAAGTHVVTVTDANGCTDVMSYTVVEPTAISLTTTSVGVTCFGLSDGSAGVTASGAAGGFSYLWLPGGGTTANVTGLGPNTYVVQVTDSLGCTASASVIVIAPAALIVSAVGTDATCNGDTDGSVTSTVSVGSGPYTYWWSPGGAVTPNLTNVGANNYILTVTDNNGCIAGATATVAEPALLAVTASSTNVSCFGGSNGTLNSTTTGGTLAYSYLWTPGNYTSPGISGVGQGTYILTVTDGNGCSASSVTTIGAPSQITFSTNVVEETCAAANGSITIAGVVGGAGGPYQYDIDGSGFGGSASFFGLSGGATYIVTVKDGANCVEAVSVNLLGVPGPGLDSVAIVEPTCNGGSDGSIELYLNNLGVLIPMPYSIDGLALQASNIFSGLLGGSHILSVIDTSGCSYDTIVFLSEPTAIAVIDSVVPASCNGACDAHVYLTVSGGNPGYTYSLGGNAGGPVFVGECAGNPILNVIDAGGCVSASNIFIAEPALETAAITYANSAYCLGVGITSPTALGSPGGVFSAPAGVSINAATGDIDLATTSALGWNTIAYTTPCGIVGTFDITFNDIDDASFSYGVDTVCLGGINPTAAIAGLAGGLFSSPSVGISFNSSTGEIDLTNTGVGTFIMTYTTIGPCPTSDSVTITTEALQVIALTGAGPFCESDGSVILSASPPGGAWASTCGACLDTTGLFSPSNAGAGVYTIYYLAGTGSCAAIDSTSIAVLAAPTYTVSGGGSYCEGDSVPPLIIQFNSGVQPYTIDINQGGSLYLDDDVINAGNVVYTALPPGTYEVVYVEGGNGCINTATSTAISITELPVPATPTASADVTICEGEAMPALTVTGSGGSGSFSWYDDGNPQILVGNGSALTPNVIATGAYWYFVDQTISGCTSLFDSVLVTVNPAPTLPTSNTLTYTICPGDSIPTLSATSNSGGALTWYSDAALTISIGSGNFHTPPGNFTGTVSLYVTETLGGCESLALEFQITIVTAGLVSDGSEVTYCLGDSIQLLASGGTTYAWRPTQLVSDPLIADPWVITDTSVLLYVDISVGDCFFTDSLFVTVTEGDDCGFHIYNAFSPEGDGINDTWTIEGIAQFPENKVIIMNRWGDKIREFENYNNNDVVWDGTGDAGELPASTYYYIIDIDNGTRQYSGWVFLSK